jgi:hypothetical protein
MHRLTKESPAAFCPPRPVRPLIQASQFLTPLVLKSVYGCHGVEYDVSQMRSFHGLRNDSVILTPNHPTKADPAVMFDMSKRIGQPFFHLANREQFDRAQGIYGKYLQSVGAYSIARGTGDRASFQQTQQLLQEKGSKVVIYPEGATFSRNDRVFAFQDGVFLLALNALMSMREKGILHDVFIQPVALKYIFTQDATPVIESSLARLELALGLEIHSTGTIISRIDSITKAALRNAEQFYKLPVKENEDTHTRLHRLKEHALSGLAPLLGVKLGAPEAETLNERARKVFNAFHRVDLASPGTLTGYEEHLMRRQAAQMNHIRQELYRLENWLDVGPNYIESHPSEERIADTIIRLEREVLGTVHFRVPTRCLVRLAQAINIRDYTAHAIGTRGMMRIAAKLARQTESAVQAELHWMRRNERRFPFIQNILRPEGSLK